jgi:hypothetical protein
MLVLEYENMLLKYKITRLKPINQPIFFAFFFTYADPARTSAPEEKARAAFLVTARPPFRAATVTKLMVMKEV